METQISEKWKKNSSPKKSRRFDGYSLFSSRKMAKQRGSNFSLLPIYADQKESKGVLLVKS